MEITLYVKCSISDVFRHYQKFVEWFGQHHSEAKDYSQRLQLLCALAAVTSNFILINKVLFCCKTGLTSGILYQYLSILTILMLYRFRQSDIDPSLIICKATRRLCR